mgnify:FL=1
MNIFTNLLSLHGYVDPHQLDDEREERYAPELGNAAASRKFFGSLGHACAQDEQRDAARPAIQGCA